MKNEKKQFLQRFIISFAFAIIPFALYFNTERCLKTSSAGFWLIFVSGISFGVALTSIILYLRKDKPEN